MAEKKFISREELFKMKQPSACTICAVFNGFAVVEGDKDTSLYGGCVYGIGHGTKGINCAPSDRASLKIQYAQLKYLAGS